MNFNYPNIKRLESILNETSFHQIYNLWINKQISHYALKILERWAENYPNTIKTLGMSDLMTLVLPQEKMEIEILSSANSKKTNKKWFNYYGNITRSRNRFELLYKNKSSTLFSTFSRNHARR
ncbi:hypothetical protein ACOTVD_03325 [Campylobacter jejuni]|uniref:hypothetical protein n=1 Tax=Campylobacter jejuni TaxID=197 RepID=UPI003B9B5AA2